MDNLIIGTSYTSPNVLAPDPNNNYDVCATLDGPVPDEPMHSFVCQTMGRYLIVQLNANNHLQLCEVQVFTGDFVPAFQ